MSEALEKKVAITGRVKLDYSEHSLRSNRADSYRIGSSGRVGTGCIPHSHRGVLWHRIAIGKANGVIRKKYWTT
jgi:hypothetical protein